MRENVLKNVLLSSENYLELIYTNSLGELMLISGKSKSQFKLYR